MIVSVSVVSHPIGCELPVGIIVSYMDRLIEGGKVLVSAECTLNMFVEDSVLLMSDVLSADDALNVFVDVSVVLNGLSVASGVLSVDDAVNVSVDGCVVMSGIFVLCTVVSVSFSVCFWKSFSCFFTKRFSSFARWL